MNIFSLTGRKVLLTGATGGLGQAIAKGLAEHGADLLLVGRNEEKLADLKSDIERHKKQSLSGKVQYAIFDLENIDDIPKFFDKQVHDLGDIDILINCAGINIRGPAENIERADWDKVLTINLSACFFLSQAFCRHRKAIGRGGKIVNIGSLMCKVARPTTTPYAASKGGLLMLTKSLACEWARYKINVNAIGPGYFLTKMTEKLQEDAKFNDWVLSNTPLGRWGEPEDLIGAVVFLSSSASDFVTGQIIYVDGGWLSLV